MQPTRRNIVHGAGALALGAAVPSLVPLTLGNAMAAAPLTTRVHTGNEKGFLVTSTLIMGERDAILVDSQFSYDNAHRLVADVLEAGKRVTQIYVTHAHPDHYFGLAVAKAAFPDARIVATRTTIQDIEKTAPKKLAQWGPQLGANGPTSAVMPEALPGMALDLEGRKIEILGPFQGDIPNNTVLWIPSTRTLIASDTVYGECHVWTADSSPEQRREWLKTLDRLAELKPEVVIPGHYKPGAPMTLAAVDHTRDYLAFFDQVAASTKKSEEIVKAVQARYPNLALPIGLNLGAKVATGEMKWG